VAVVENSLTRRKPCQEFHLKNKKKCLTNGCQYDIMIIENEREVKNMYIAIIIFTVLSIFGESHIEKNNKEINLNLFAIIDLILIIIYF
jgi:hypothetical protein